MAGCCFLGDRHDNNIDITVGLVFWVVGFGVTQHAIVEFAIL